METQREKLEREEARLRASLSVLDAQWEKLPRFFALALLAIPTGFVLGWKTGFVVLVGALAFVLTAAYLIGFRRREHHEEIAIVRGDLARLERFASEARARHA